MRRTLLLWLLGAAVLAGCGKQEAPGGEIGTARAYADRTLGDAYDGALDSGNYAKTGNAVVFTDPDRACKRGADCSALAITVCLGTDGKPVKLTTGDAQGRPVAGTCDRGSAP